MQKSTTTSKLAAKSKAPSAVAVDAADDACEKAHQALRRWETLPEPFDQGRKYHKELEASQGSTRAKGPRRIRV